MTSDKHPGIYINEIPAARSIQGVATSVAAFIGVTETGPFETPTLITSWNEYQRQFGGLVWFGFVSWSVFEFFNEGGTTCYVVRVKDTASATAASGNISGLRFSAVTSGSWGNHLSLMISPKAKSSTNTATFDISVLLSADQLTPTDGKQQNLVTQLLAVFVTKNNLSHINIAQTAYYELETFNGLSIATDSPSAMAASATALQARINSNSIFIRVDTSKFDGSLANLPTLIALSGGTDPNHDFEHALLPVQAINDISLLAIPDTTTISDVDKKTSLVQQAAIINKGLRFCEQQEKIVYVCDPPSGLTVEEISDFKLGTNNNSQPLNSSFGAIYYPWVWVFNPFGNCNVPIPPSGPTLGRYAYTDQQCGVWKSPAGINEGALKTVVELDTRVTDADQNRLNPESINAIRNFINFGNVIWGARTLSADTVWTYIATRRLVIFIEQSLKQSLQWVTFETNNQALWSAVNRDVSAFLTALWQQGALFGSTASEAFFVTCDASNNPPESRSIGQLSIEIGLAVIYPAEFIILKFMLKTGTSGNG